VIHDLDESIRELLRRDALAGTDVEVAFDAPTREWSARRNAPTLDVYLYDIREDTRWRSSGSVGVRDEDGFVARRASPPRYFRFAYLVTAWTQRPEDEHRLLSSVLSCFLADDRLPPDVLAGSLAGHPLPISLTIAQPPPQDRSISEVWTALGGELKPSLDLVLVAALEAGPRRPVGPPVLEEPRIRVRGEEASRAPARRRRRPAPEAEGAGAEVAETVTGGGGARPGRTFPVRAVGRSPHRR